MAHFTSENTEGYTAAQLVALNVRATELLVASGIGVEDDRFADAVKTAGERAVAELDRAG